MISFMPIKNLSQDVWSKIAAGEVIERPVSAVKELVENSIDAGANNINISLQDGGRLRIIIEDNGAGIEFNELPLAIEYHATSKIQTIEDLENVMTLGYRGEALASLTAVANLEITSKIKNSPNGGVIKTFNGRVIKHAQVNCNNGTRIQIDDLFGTLPARRKFLKSASGELKRCANLVREYAICRPDIIFTLENDGKMIFSTDGSGDRRRVLEKLWNAESEIQCVQIKTQHMNLECWFQAKYGRNDVTAFVNSRAVNDNTIKTAVNSAARDMNGNWALLFSLEPSLVDVNIHPAKAEVRFRYPSEIYEALKLATYNIGAPQNIFTEQKHEQEHEHEKSEPLKFSSASPYKYDTPKKFQDNNYESKQSKSFIKPVQKNLFDTEISQPQSQIIYLGQTMTGYLIFDKPDEIILIDPHAAHERINYERIKNIASQNENTQKLLLPVLLHPTLALEVQEYLKELNDNGFEIENTSGGLSLNGIPAAVSEIEEPEILLRISLAALRENHDGDIKNLLWRTWATQACKMSVKLTNQLSRYEAVELWRKLNECEQPFTCPHGRPTILKISRQDLAKHFGRE